MRSDAAHEFFNTYGIVHSPSTDHHQQANGQVESKIKFLKKVIKSKLDEGIPWRKALAYSEIAVNNNLSNASTKISPHMATYGYEWQSPGERKIIAHLKALNGIHAQVAENLQRSSETMRKHYDKDKKLITFIAGDWVLVNDHDKKSKWEDKRIGPFRIVEVLPRNNYLVHNHIKSTWKPYNVQYLELFIPRLGEDGIFQFDDMPRMKKAETKNLEKKVFGQVGSSAGADKSEGGLSFYTPMKMERKSIALQKVVNQDGPGVPPSPSRLKKPPKLEFGSEVELNNDDDDLLNTKLKRQTRFICYRNKDGTEDKFLGKRVSIFWPTIGPNGTTFRGVVTRKNKVTDTGSHKVMYDDGTENSEFLSLPDPETGRVERCTILKRIEKDIEIIWMDEDESEEDGEDI